MVRIDGKGAFRLVIETENVAAWMDINNNFTLNAGQKPNYKENYWTGVLVQLGIYDEQGSSKPMPAFDRIEIYSKGQAKPSATITQQQFVDTDNPTWISIFAKVSKKKDAMNEDDLPKLHLKSKLGSLDCHFHPFPGGITLWSEKGYDLKVEEMTEKHWPWKLYTFRTREEQHFTFEIHGKGAPQPTPQDVNMIKVCAPADLPDGSHQSPPIQP